MMHSEKAASPSFCEDRPLVCTHKKRRSKVHRQEKLSLGACLDGNYVYKGCEKVTNEQRYRRFLWVFLGVGVALLFFCLFLFLEEKIPDHINLVQGEEQTLNFDLPQDAVIYEAAVEADASGAKAIPKENLHITGDGVIGNKTGDYAISCKLFGIIPIKSIQVSVVEQNWVYPCGDPVGIYMKTDGVLVVGTGSIKGMDGISYEPAYHIVQSGDYILSANGTETPNKETLIQTIHESQGKPITLRVRRGEEEMEMALQPVMTEEQDYKVGIWVRSDTQGIGTMTYVDSQGHFGALGHGINDIDTSTLLELKKGTLYASTIRSVIKGSKGVPGELAGVIHYRDDAVLGTIEKNTETGIFGTLSCDLNCFHLEGPVEVAYKQDVETGPAVIRSALNGTVKEYDIEIEKVYMNSSDANKGMVIKVTDPELLELTGGIVQGMSGSPILQNGKLIGAVTHVFVQDSTSGYGIFIENMLRQ